jgi:hypothetical protein
MLFGVGARKRQRCSLRHITSDDVSKATNEITNTYNNGIKDIIGVECNFNNIIQGNFVTMRSEVTIVIKRQ